MPGRRRGVVAGGVAVSAVEGAGDPVRFGRVDVLHDVLLAGRGPADVGGHGVAEGPEGGPHFLILGKFHAGFDASGARPGKTLRWPSVFRRAEGVRRRA